MSSNSTDRDWERLGERDPYWAVLSDSPYHRDNLSDAHLQAFLESGHDHLEAIWRTCEELFGASFAPRRALDFGCGVGRVTLPLARRVPSVVGVDVADSMLAEARALMGRQGITNVRLVKGDDTLTGVEGPFDFIHSVLVFQHVPPERGLRIIRRLIALLGERGAAALHVLYRNPFQRSLPARLAHQLVRPLRGLRHPLPEIQMHAYPMNAVLQSIQEAGVARVHVDLQDHAGHSGAMLFFRKR